MSDCTSRMNSGNNSDLSPDELVMHIEIQWSDQRTNTEQRTLNEVSILERDMRHGMYFSIFWNKFEKKSKKKDRKY